MDKQSNIRLILAVAISFLVIVLWSKYFAPQPEIKENSTQNAASKDSNATPNATKPPNTTQGAQVAQSTQNTAPNIANAKDFAPNMQNTQHNQVYAKPLLVKIESSEFDMDIDVNGAISQVYLKADKFTQPPQEGIFTHLGRLFGMVSGENKKLDKLPLFSNNIAAYPLQMLFVEPSYNNLSQSTNYTANKTHIKITDTPESVVLTQNLGDLLIEKIITIYPNMTYDVAINLSKNVKYVISNGMRPNADSEAYVFHGVVLQKQNGSIEKIEDGDAKEAGENFSDVLYIASADRYYTSVLFKPQGVLGVVSVDAFGKGLPRPFINVEAQNESFKGYIGPKDYKLLESIDKNLVSIVEYGRITFFAKYIFTLLDWLYGYVDNWGVAIVLLTIIIRIILFPLSFKGMVGMQKLKDLAPKMKEIQEKHKGDPQKMQAAMMELYKKHGANPLGGCLPLLLQIPVFFAIYRVLYNAVELKNAPLMFWVHDLSVMDPYFVLPLLMGLSMYLQQSLTPTTITDPLQAKVFKWLPVIFTIFLITFPAGLILYWTINNVISIIQQLIINKMLDMRKVKEIAAHDSKIVTKNTRKHKK